MNTSRRAPRRPGRPPLSLQALALPPCQRPCGRARPVWSRSHLLTATAVPRPSSQLPGRQSSVYTSSWAAPQGGCQPPQSPARLGRHRPAARRTRGLTRTPRGSGGPECSRVTGRQREGKSQQETRVAECAAHTSGREARGVPSGDSRPDGAQVPLTPHRPSLRGALAGSAASRVGARIAAVP